MARKAGSGTAKAKKKNQVNIYPTPEMEQMIASAIERYGPNHRVARTKSAIISEIAELYLPAWLELMEAKDQVQSDHMGKVRAAQPGESLARHASRG